MGNWGFVYSNLSASVKPKWAQKWYGLPLLGVGFATFIAVSITTCQLLQRYTMLVLFFNFIVIVYVTIYGISLYKIYRIIKNQQVIRKATGVDVQAQVNLKWMLIHLVFLMLSSVSITLVFVARYEKNFSLHQLVNTEIVAVIIDRVVVLGILGILWSLNNEVGSQEVDVKAALIQSMIRSDTTHSMRYKKEGVIRVPTEERDEDAQDFIRECDLLSETSTFLIAGETSVSNWQE